MRRGPLPPPVPASSRTRPPQSTQQWLRGCVAVQPCATWEEGDRQARTS